MVVTLPVTNGTDTCQTLSVLTAIHNNYKQIRGCHMSPSLSNGTDTCQTLSILTAIHNNYNKSVVVTCHPACEMVPTPVKHPILTAIHNIIIRIPNIIPTVDNYSKSMYIIITQNKSYSTLSIVYNACHLIGIKQRYDKAGFKYKTQSSQKYSYIVNDLT